MASSPGPISLSVSYPGQITLQISLDQLFTCNSAQSHGLQPRPDQSLASSRCHSHFFVCLANPAHTQVDDLHPNTNPGPISLSLHQDVTLIFRLSCQSCTHRWMISIHNTNPGPISLSLHQNVTLTFSSVLPILHTQVDDLHPQHQPRPSHGLPLAAVAAPAPLPPSVPIPGVESSNR